MVNTASSHRLLLGALGLAIIWSFAGLLAHVWFEVSTGILANDTYLFQTVGKGILNGLVPYIDLFETKPPGVFLLHALSWKLFDSQFLVKLVQAVVLLAMPFTVLLFGLSRMEGREPKERQILSLLSFLFGILLALYCANQSGMGLLESHAALFGIVFIGLASLGPSLRWKQHLLCGVLLLTAVGLKEPILLSALGGLILLEYSVRQVGKTMGISFIIAGIIGVLALIILGYFDAFFGVYMKYMLGFHVGQSDVPLPLRALEVWRVFINLGIYSWFFAVAVTFLWVWIPLRAWVWRSRPMALRWLVGSYVTLLSIAMGGSFYGHHFVFAVPFFVAVYWEAITAFPKKSMQFLLPLCILFIVTAFVDTRFSFAAQASAWSVQESEHKRIAAVMDDVMDNCGWEKYLQMMPRGMGPYAYTDHSPYGPVFIHYSREIGAMRSFQVDYIRALKEAPFMLILDLENSNLTDFAKQYVGVHFDKEAPTCAGEDFVQPEPYHLLFRQE